MNLPDNYGLEQFNILKNRQLNNKKINQNYKNDRELKKAVSNFTSIFLQKMFKSMRDTLPENKLLDGGFAEDVYRDMLDKEVSKQGAAQAQFNQLNEQLYRQLSNKNEVGE